MTWEWSHTQEAYTYVEDQLYKQSHEWLAEVWAEWKSYEIEKAQEDFNNNLEDIKGSLINTDLDEDRVIESLELPSILNTSPHFDGRYVSFKKRAMTMDKDKLAEDIWVWMSGEHGRRCTNGGFYAYACPDGCNPHLIPFSPKEEAD